MNGFPRDVEGFRLKTSGFVELLAGKYKETRACTVLPSMITTLVIYHFFPLSTTGRGAAQNQKSVHDQYTLDILAVHKNQYNQYIKNSNVLINQYTKNLNFSTWKDYFQYNKKT